MDLGFTGKVAVITGGASGIGAETARMFLEEGCKVAVCGRNIEKLESFQKEMTEKGYELLIEVADVTSMADMERLAEKTEEAYGGIDIWVNNAGADKYTTLVDCTEEHWHEAMNINLTGVFRGSKVAVPYLEKRGGGSIINLSSFCSQVPTAKNGPYSIAKAGVNALTKVLAGEVAPKNIRVNAIIPGFIQTGMTTEQIDQIREMLLAPISLHRFGKPEEIAGGILYLASEKMASYVSGHCLVISGGKFIVQNPMDPWNNYEGGY